GKLPKDIPAWFDQLDTDRDWQIGLYEWVKSERSIEEFRIIDRNEDGFLTIDEVMTYVRGGKKSVISPGDAIASANGFGGNGLGAFGNGGMRFGDNNMGGDNRGRPRGGP